MADASDGRQAIVTGLVVAVAALAAGTGALARDQAGPTVSACARLELGSPSLRHSLTAASVFCLRPSSIRTTASVKWTTCPSTPLDEACEEGTISVSFHSTAPGFSSDPGGGPDSWGGENYPGAGIYSLPGSGTYRCEGYSVDRQQGRTVYARHTATLPLRDQAAGFAAVGSKIVVTTSVSPGQRSRLGQAAAVRLGQPNSCILSQLPIGPAAVRAAWPGKPVSVASLGGSSTTVSSSGTLARSFPLGGIGATPGVRISGTVRWTSTVVVVSALKR